MVVLTVREADEHGASTGLLRPDEDGRQEERERQTQ
jgi:hypothetical protein